MKHGRKLWRECSLAIAIALATLECLTPRAGYGHGTPPPDLSFWGPFSRGTARCLRRISYATRVCFEEVLAVQSECIERRLSGLQCDDQARQALVDAALERARGVVAPTCTGGQLTELRYAGFDDARTDISNACLHETDAVLSLLYPINVTGSDPSQRQCLIDNAAVGRKVVRHVLTARSDTFDRIAARVPLPSVKLALVDAVNARAARAKQQCAAQLESNCPSFASIYGRTPAAWVDAAVRRTECAMLATYYQAIISCPTPACGNGIKEPLEGCDDGNQVDDDRCRNSCQLN